MGITQREGRMLSLAEEGLSPTEIAQIMRIKPQTVKASLADLSGSDTSDRLARASIAQGSRQLLASLREQGMG